MSNGRKRKITRESTRGTQKSEPKSGRPGGGRGRREDVRGSRVYPASGPKPKGPAKVQGMASWGQGTRGAAGYEDSGRSEMSPPPTPEAPAADGRCPPSSR